MMFEPYTTHKSHYMNQGTVRIFPTKSLISCAGMRRRKNWSPSFSQNNNCIRFQVVSSKTFYFVSLFLHLSIDFKHYQIFLFNRSISTNVSNAPTDMNCVTLVYLWGWFKASMLSWNFVLYFFRSNFSFLAFASVLKCLPWICLYWCLWKKQIVEHLSQSSLETLLSPLTSHIW